MSKIALFGAALASIVELFSIVVFWSKTIPFLAKIAVMAWNLAKKLQIFYGTWIVPGIIAFAGTITAVIAIIIPVGAMIYYCIESMVNYIRSAFS